MNNIIYHEIIPNNLQQSYTEFQNVDFDLSFPNRKINLGSVRLEGELEVTYDSEFLNSAVQKDPDGTAGGEIFKKDIKMDGMVGGHSLFESITTTINSPDKGKNVIENLNEYPRYVKMANSASSSRDDQLNSNNMCELKASFDRYTTNLLQGVFPKADTTPSARLNPDFSVRPLFCLNSGSGALSYNKSGDIQVSVTLGRVFSVLFGNDCNSKVKYAIRDLRLRFTSSPEDGNDDQIVMKTKLNIKSSIQSSFSNIQVRVPAVCSAVTVSFQNQIDENTGANNNYALQSVPNLKQTQFLFNDSTNTLISYLIRSVSEVQDRAIDSMLDTGRNNLSTQNLANNNGFLAGIDFGSLIDLSDTKFSLQLSSGISSNSPMIAYMYFHSLVEM